ncbi:MAG: hypothetical protein JW849_10505 [Phycisphaerae bacterium]|nr:hypothetical protein [Phycisphaerae bacterium]
MNDLEALQNASTRKTRPASHVKRAGGINHIHGWIALLMILGVLGVIAYIKFYPGVLAKPLNLIVYGAENGAAFRIENRDDRAVRLSEFVVNDHYTFAKPEYKDREIPSGTPAIILYSSLFDERGERYNPLTHHVRNVRIVCHAEDGAAWEYNGVPPEQSVKK